MTASRATTALRTSALIALGAFALHQLRYAVAHGTAPPGAHAYLETVFPLLLVLVASGIAGSIATAAARRGDPRAARLGWGQCTAALLGIYLFQETAEGSSLAAHHGWVVIPIAIAVARVVAWCASLVAAVERRLVLARGPRPRRAPASIGGARRRAACVPACASLAFGFARRPPPVLA